MLSILKSLKDKIAPPVKAVASNRFIDNINQYDKVKEKLPTKDELLEEKYRLLFEEGLKELEHFASAPDNHNYLNIASKKFHEVIDIRKDKAEPYFYLSYIGYLQKNTNTTIKYLQMANLIDPDIPGLDSLRKEIINSLSGS